MGNDEKRDKRTLRTGTELKFACMTRKQPIGMCVAV